MLKKHNYFSFNFIAEPIKIIDQTNQNLNLNNY